MVSTQVAVVMEVADMVAVGMEAVMKVEVGVEDVVVQCEADDQVEEWEEGCLVEEFLYLTAKQVC